MFADDEYPKAADGQGHRRESDTELHGALGAVWRSRILIVSIAIGAAIVGAAFAFLTPKRYQASVVALPVSSESPGSRLSGSLSQLGGIASLAGITLPSSNERTEAVATLQSETLTRSYVAQKELLPILFADRWDPAAKKWRTTQQDQIPTVWKASQFFEKRVRTIVEDKKAGLITVTVTWTDPRLAAEWANGLVEMTNDYLRSKAIQESDTNMAYLREQAARSDLLEARNAIYSVLQTEINKAMLARGTREYALKVVDRAFPPEKASSPRPVLWTIAAFLLGLLGSMTAVLLAQTFRSTR
jgi:uncharacterized protein involved in exopolysaccharide biosynthesis